MLTWHLTTGALVIQESIHFSSVADKVFGILQSKEVFILMTLEKHLNYFELGFFLTAF